MAASTAIRLTKRFSLLKSSRIAAAPADEGEGSGIAQPLVLALHPPFPM